MAERRNTITWLNTGWIEQIEPAHFHGGGLNPAAPGGKITAWGAEPETVRPDGSVSHGSVMIPTTVWLVRSGDTVILIDTGVVDLAGLALVHGTYEGPLAHVVTPEMSLLNQLAGHGVRPEDVDIIVQSHLHYDHLGALDQFPNATILVNPLEVAWALCPQPFSLYYYPEFRDIVLSVLDRVRLVGDRHTVAPGITMVRTGGHSPGHSVVFVETADGTAALLGDLVYHYRSLELDIPSATNFNLGESVAAIQMVKENADILLLNHDPLVEKLIPDGVGTAPLAPEVHEYMARLRTTGSFSPLADGAAEYWPKPH